MAAAEDLKIGVVGCGALGSYYGARLLRAGHRAHFLVRSDFEALSRKPLHILSPEGNFHVCPKIARDPAEIGICDLVLIGLKTTANARLPDLLPPLVGKDTAVLTLQNGLGSAESIAELFSPKQVLGGLCFVCINRLEPGTIEHQAYGKIVLGEFAGAPEPRTHELALMFDKAGVPCVVTDNLERAQWEKLVWNIPFNGLGVAGSVGAAAVETGRLEEGTKPGATLTTDVLLGDGRWLSLVRGLMDEVIDAANARGLGVKPELADKMIANTRSMGAYKASTLVDFERGSPLELETMFLEPLRRARQAGVATPRLEALCRVLETLNPE